MTHIAELVVRHPDFPLAPTLEAFPDLDLQTESQPVTASDAPTLFFSVMTPDFERFEEALTADRTVTDWESVTDLADRRVYQVRFGSEVGFLVPRLTDLGLRVLSTTAADGGWRFRIHVPDREQLAQFLTYCRQEDVEYRIDKLYGTDGRDSVATATDLDIQLTDRQREVARTATEMGYFDRGGASPEEIAAELDITPSTLSSHLRTITAKIFQQLFGT